MNGFAERLQSRSVFKFIVGINNWDQDEVRFLTHVYGVGGADIIDVAARPDVVAATRQALAEARTPEGERGPAPHIMASLALKHDPHLDKEEPHPEHRPFIVPTGTGEMARNVAACLAEGAEMVELHASNSDDHALVEAVGALSAVLGGRYLSVCLGTEGLRSPRDAIRQAGLVLAIHGPRTMIQAEGIVLAKDGSPGSSLQSLALAQALLARTTAFVIAAGGANEWTRELTLLLGIPVHGIASGSYARSLVQGFLAGGDRAAAAGIARRFARRAKGGPYEDGYQGADGLAELGLRPARLGPREAEPE